MKTPAEIVRVIYSTLSGRAHEPRDWARFRECFHQDARMIPVRRNERGETIAETFSVEEYIASRSKLLETGDFCELERASMTTICGHVAHVLSEYESRHAANRMALTVGANTVQFVKQGNEWKIISASWDTLGMDAH